MATRASTPRQLSTADQRRETVLRTAIRAFAARGYYGTTTTEVAKAAGISQAYVYRLFPDKQSLFIAVIEHCAARMRDSLAGGAAQATGADAASVLAALKQAYGQLVEDRDLLLVLMHANCAASEPPIRDAIRSCYAKQVEYVRAASGASDDEIQKFIAAGLLANVLLAIDAKDVDAPWAHTLLTDMND